MDIGNDGHEASPGAEFGDDMLQISGVFDRGRGDADELTTDGDELESLLHAFGCVHGVTGQHGLNDNRVSSANNDAAPGRVADDHLAGRAAFIGERRFAITHSYFFGANTTGSWRFLRALRTQSPVSKKA